MNVFLTSLLRGVIVRQRCSSLQPVFIYSAQPSSTLFDFATPFRCVFRPFGEEAPAKGQSRVCRHEWGAHGFPLRRCWPPWPTSSSRATPSSSSRIDEHTRRRLRVPRGGLSTISTTLRPIYVVDTTRPHRLFCYASCRSVGCRT